MPSLCQDALNMPQSRAHAQAVLLTEALGAFDTSPSQFPASDVSLQCWPGTGVIRVLKSALISGYRSTCGLLFSSLNVFDRGGN